MIGFRSKLKKDDQVIVISGSDRGKRGKVLFVDNKKGRVIVEGINIKTKHVKQNQQNAAEKGIVKLEFPFQLSNVMYFCDKCKKGVRLGNHKDEKSSSRVCKKCGKSID